MVCPNCGNKILANSQHCVNCGVDLPNVPPENRADQELVFIKGKMLGNIVYKRTKTTVQVYPDALNLLQETKKVFRKARLTEKTLPLTNIQSVRVKTVIDFWDALYGIIAVILGIIAHPALFLLGAVCFWCAYGRQLEFILSDSSTFKIPFARSKQNADYLLTLCSKSSTPSV